MTSSYSRFNLIIYPLLEKLGGELNVLRYQFNTLIETQQFIKEYIKTNDINMFEIQEELHIKSSKQCNEQITKTIIERIINSPKWSFDDLMCCHNYYKNIDWLN